MSQFRSLVGTASVFLAIVVGTSVATVPTPVYPLIAAQLGLDPLGITVTFAVFALGAVLGLAIGATAAARLPRRRVYLISAAVQALAALILALDLGVAGFVAGRAATGIGAGLLAASGTALLLELAGGLRSRAQAALRLVAPAAAYLGLALGSGLPAAAQVATPTDLQWLFAGLAVAILALLTVSVSYRAPAAVEVPLGGSVPRSRLPWAAVLGPFAAFMTTGLFGSITAILLELLGLGSAGLSGVLAGAVFLAGAGGVVLIAPRLSLPAIGVLLATSLTAVALGAELGSLPLLLVASTAAGRRAGRSSPAACDWRCRRPRRPPASGRPRWSSRRPTPVWPCPSSASGWRSGCCPPGSPSGGSPGWRRSPRSAPPGERIAPPGTASCCWPGDC